MKKKGVILDYLPWLIIAIIVLAIMLIGTLVLKEKGISIIDSIKNLLKT